MHQNLFELKIFLGRGHSPLPRPSSVRRGHPFPTPYPPRRLDPHAYGARSSPISNINRRHCSVIFIGYHYCRYSYATIACCQQTTVLGFLDIVCLRALQHFHAPYFTIWPYFIFCDATSVRFVGGRGLPPTGS